MPLVPVKFVSSVDDAQKSLRITKSVHIASHSKWFRSSRIFDLECVSFLPEMQFWWSEGGNRQPDFFGASSHVNFARMDGCVNAYETH